MREALTAAEVHHTQSGEMQLDSSFLSQPSFDAAFVMKGLPLSSWGLSHVKNFLGSCREE